METERQAQRFGWVGPLGLALGLTAGLGGIALRYLVRRGLPVLDGILRLQGLESHVEVDRDRWGVPHIYAGSNADLFFAQGFVHAQDRLWQMEVCRRLSQGLLSEAFGPEALEVDRFFRRLGLHRVARADLEVSGPVGREALEAYAHGVNAFLQQAGNRLPLEFGLARVTPRPWTPLDSLSFSRYMAWIMADNWIAELVRSRFIDHLGPEEASKLEPGVWPTEGDGSFDELRMILRQAQDERARGDAGRERGRGRETESGSNGEMGRGSSLLTRFRSLLGRPAHTLIAPSLGLSISPSLPFSLSQGTPGASNGWAISGEKSVTGKPLLANDPHLFPLQPASWYEVHLCGGEYHVAGASLAGVPGVVVGHNERIAWGVTAGIVDVQDLYVERLDPSDPQRYEVQGRWEQAEVVRESIPVRGQGQPVVEEVLITRHGPVLTPTVILPGEHRTLALRSQVLQPAPLADTMLALDRAGSWDEFQQVLATWNVPPLNFVYADVDGNIGYQMAARVPVRARGTGLAPAPGWSGEYEWVGQVPFDELPSSFNPPQGYAASANNCPVGTDYPHHLTREWCAPFRYQRICQVLESRPRLTALDFRDLHMDFVCLPGKEVAEYLSRGPGVGGQRPVSASGNPRPATDPWPPTPEEAWALAELRAWDGTLSAESVAGTLYEVFKTRFLSRRYGDLLGDLLPGLLGQGLHPVAAATSNYAARLSQIIVDTLRQQGDQPEVQEQARAALRDALDFLRQQLGPDSRRWQWGRLHRLTFRHTLSSRKPLNRVFDLGPFPIGGDADTPFQTACLPPSLEAEGWCPSYRQICDLENWDHSLAVLPTGQSGQRPSPHYADQLVLWLNGNYHPLPFSRSAVRDHTQATLRLLPLSVVGSGDQPGAEEAKAPG